jgi:hypothetical protein
MLLRVVPVISLSSILSSLIIVSLSGPRHIVLAHDLLFRCMKSLVTGHIHPQIGHIRPSADISDLRPDISDPTVLTIQI